MLTTIVIAVVALLALGAALLAVAASKPNTFRIERAARIAAPPERIFALITDLRGWSAWSPYEKLDPAMKRTFSGAAAGTGAVYEWDGNGKVGAGRMEITEAAAPAKIVIKLDFLRPFEGHNVAEFTIQPVGPATNVTWSMRGASQGFAKLMCTVFNMDRMIGTQFEIGLANLKAVAEA